MKMGKHSTFNIQHSIFNEGLTVSRIVSFGVECWALNVECFPREMGI